ncbi:MAG: efflux transporter outer membrane subunit [Bacteroidetes bacterium]|nr:efflux transporter outer membrane subunit [Bacteroidota bacterium]
MIRNKNIAGFFLILFFSVFLGCKVGQKYVRPTLELPEEYRNAITSRDSSIANIPWKNFFTDPTLQQLIDSAVAKNFDMQIAMKNIARAQKIFSQSKLGYWPDVNGQIAVGTNRPSNNSLNGLNAGQFLGTRHIEDYSANISITWEADIWGKISNQKQAALSDYLQSAEAKKAIQTQLVADVAQGFYNLLALDAQLEIAKRNYLLDDSTVRIIRLQYDAGQTTALAIEQADAQKLAAGLLIPSLEQEIAIQENALRVLSGELPSAVSRNITLGEFQVNDMFSTGIPAEMVSLRPDVRANELGLQAANARAGIAQANMYPTLAITASGGVNSFKATNWFNIPASLFGAATASITQPIFQRRQLRTQYELAKIEREKSVIVFRQSVLNAVGEVSDALIRVEKLKEQRSIAMARADTLQNATRNANLLFRNGMANYLEVITAQANALQSQLQVADLKRQHLNSLVDLYRSLGGGWR